MGSAMSRCHTQPSTERLVLVPRIKVWLESEGRYAFGFGISEILQAVDRAGSIKQAASDLDKSYRYVWGRIKAAERVLGRPLVLTQVGGKGVQRSSLTPLARQLMTDFLALRRHLMDVAQGEFAQFFGHRDRGLDSES
jgi:molybdate transport system regulatory protein